MPFDFPAALGSRDGTEAAELSGTTQTCTTSCIRGRDVAHFSHPINIDLQFDIDLLDNKGFLPKWPQVKLLFLEMNIHHS